MSAMLLFHLQQSLKLQVSEHPNDADKLCQPCYYLSNSKLIPLLKLQQVSEHQNKAKNYVSHDTILFTLNCGLH